MLLFIELADCLDCDEICFNTSHVTLYQDYPAADRSENIVSIHLMLLFITAEGVKVDLSNVFQYISCYSLSLRQIQLQTLISRFNTSHVTLYRSIWCWFCRGRSVSIHLMLLFIQEGSYGMLGNTLFQYISCYSLSLAQASANANTNGFNTSHVTLYPNQFIKFSNANSFQYISCYSLSAFARKYLQEARSFNTSHVTLYPADIERLYSWCDVSIHLMLLFIIY